MVGQLNRHIHSAIYFMYHKYALMLDRVALLTF